VCLNVVYISCDHCAGRMLFHGVRGLLRPVGLRGLFLVGVWKTLRGGWAALGVTKVGSYPVRASLSSSLCVCVVWYLTILVSAFPNSQA